MSAYALPGLFPPIGDVFSESKANIDSNTTSSSSSVEQSTENKTGPLHTQQQHQHQQQQPSGISGILKASVDRFCPQALSPYACITDESKSESNNSNEKKNDDDEACPGIAVKEAKIDPIRLVQCVTGASPVAQNGTNRKLRRRGSTERLDSPQHSPNTRKSLKQVSLDDKATTTTTTTSTPHDEAIEFELSISLNGRKYTATRTLQCIVQLRDDLIREMQNRRRWLQVRKACEQPFPSAFTSLDKIATLKLDGVDGSGADDYDESALNIQIPEIPPITGEDPSSAGSHGFVGRGFTMLHAMVTSYVPVMERWLRNVMTIVPQDSECLSNFLWEPEIPIDFAPVDFSSKSCASLATLGSIKEMDYTTEDDDEDSEDEWEG